MFLNIEEVALLGWLLEAIAACFLFKKIQI